MLEGSFSALCAAANDVRAHFCGNVFDVCTIINGITIEQDMRMLDELGYEVVLRAD